MTDPELMPVIINAPDQKTVDLIKFIVTQKFKSTKPVVITFSKRSHKQYNGLCDPKEGWSKITIYPHTPPSCILHSIAHELRHVQQNQNKMFSGEAKYNKAREADANAFAATWVKDFTETLSKIL